MLHEFKFIEACSSVSSVKGRHTSNRSRCLQYLIIGPGTSFGVKNYVLNSTHFPLCLPVLSPKGQVGGRSSKRYGV